MEKQPTCEERIDKELEREIQRIKEASGQRIDAFDTTCNACGHKWQTEACPDICPECDSDDTDAELVEPEETRDSYMEGILSIDAELVFRVQLSTGGPGDEFLVYVDMQDRSISKIVYRFLDWWDSAERALGGEDFDLVSEMFQDIADNWEMYAKIGG